MTAHQLYTKIAAISVAKGWIQTLYEHSCSLYVHTALSDYTMPFDSLEEKEEYDPSGRKTYMKTCEALGIIPTSYFLRTIQSGQSHINMGHHGVGPKGAKAIAISLTVSLLFSLLLLEILTALPCNQTVLAEH